MIFKIFWVVVLQEVEAIVINSMELIWSRFAY